MSRMTKAQQTERDEAIERLREWIKPGDTIHTIIRSVARSGMSRRLDVYKLHEQDVSYLTYNVALAIGARMGPRDDGLVVGGCGFDAGFDTIYRLGLALWPDGFDCVGDRCPSNDHCNNPRGPHGHHSSGGYALNHRWLG